MNDEFELGIIVYARLVTALRVHTDVPACLPPSLGMRMVVAGSLGGAPVASGELPSPAVRRR